MPELERLAALSDRGDDFFARFAAHYSALLAEQDAGRCACYVPAGQDGAVLGRFNLAGIHPGSAELGYRVAQHAAGRGVATATVRRLCGLAAAELGLRTVRAAVAGQNAASRRALVKAGLVPAGPAGPAHLGGREGWWYQRDLSSR